jgi:hypothetical protein
VLPPPEVPREHWSTTEQLAVPLLHLASWYASRTIYGRSRSERKLVALDETHFLGQWGAGRALFTRLGRDSRKWNTCVLAASQNPVDVLGMEVSNFISSSFVGRIEDEAVAADALRMLRVQTGVGYEAVLARLSPRVSTNTRSGYREFIMRDVDGNVDKMRVDLDHLPQLLKALDTTANPYSSTDNAELKELKRAPERIRSLGEVRPAALPAGNSKTEIDKKNARPERSVEHSEVMDDDEPPLPGAGIATGWPSNSEIDLNGRTASPSAEKPQPIKVRR